MSRSAVLGIDIGGGHLSAGLYVPSPSSELQLIASEETPNTADSIPSLIDQLLALVGRLLDVAGGVRVLGVGIGVPGQVHRGVLVAASNLPYLRQADLAGEVGGRLGVPARLYNDANCAVAAEVLGAERRRTAAMLTLGTGVGLGLVIEGRPYSGDRGMVEGGHSILVPGGRRCSTE